MQDIKERYLSGLHFFFYCPLALFYLAILLWLLYQHSEIWRIRIFEVNATKYINLLIGSLSSVSNSMPASVLCSCVIPVRASESSWSKVS